MRKLKGIVPGWSYSINNWEKHRNNHHRESMLPLTIFSVVGVFMLLMVALGLFGVLWQNVTRRTQEIGLRKAMGATKGKIYAQITGELLVVALFGMLLAILVLVQFPLLGVIPELDWTTFSLGLGSSIALMLALAMICAFYPSRVATGYTPAAALHYE